jgi:hypothetical protein
MGGIFVERCQTRLQVFVSGEGNETLVDTSGTSPQAECVNEKEPVPYGNKCCCLVISSPIVGDTVSKFFRQEKIWEEREVIGFDGIQHLISWDQVHGRERLNLSTYKWKKSSKVCS